MAGEGLDFGGLAALSGVDNWAEKRNDRERDAQRIQILNAYAQQDNQRQQMAAQEFHDTLSQISNIKILPFDPNKKALEDKESELRGKLAKSIQNAHGDVADWLDSGGRIERAKYIDELQNSDEFKQGMLNSANYNMANVALQKGMMLRPVSWQEGKTATFDENLAALKAGKTKQLNFAGAYKVPDIEDPAKFFSEQYGNEQHTPQTLDPKERQGAEKLFSYYERQGLDKGMQPADAKHLAAFRTALDMQNGTQYQYKSDKQPTPEDLTYKRLRNEALRNHITQQISNSNDSWQAVTSGQNAMGITKDEHGNEVLPQITADANSYAGVFGAPPDEKMVGKPVQVGIKITPLSEPDKKAMATMILGTTYDKNAGGKGVPGYVGRMINGDHAISAVNLMPLTGNINDHKFIIKDIDHVVQIQPPQGSNLPPKNYLLVYIDLSRSDASDLGLWEHNTVFPDRANKASEGSGRQGATTEGTLGRTFPILVALDNVPLNLRQAYTKKVKLGTLSQEDVQDYMNEPAESETGP